MQAGGHLCCCQRCLTEVGRVVVGGAVESELSQVGNQTGDPSSVDTLTLTQHIQLQHSRDICRHQRRLCCFNTTARVT